MDIFTYGVIANLVITLVLLFFINLFTDVQKLPPIILEWVFITFCSLPVWLFVACSQYIWSIIVS